MTLTIPRAGALLAALALSGALPGRTDAAADDLAAAVAAPDRPAEQVAHDAERRPEAVLAFAGVKPGDRVADFMSGGGYFTRLFSHIVGSNGHVYAFLPDEQLRNCSPDEVAGTRALEHGGANANHGAADANHGGAYANVSVLTGPVSRFHPPEPVDVVWTSLNFHDLYDSFMGPADVPQVVRAMFEALKPGGELLVIDHAAEAGSGVRDTETLHRIDPDVIIRTVEAAGFRLEAKSDLLRNAQDTHQQRVFDPAVRWRTDQVILKFRKPPAAAPAAAAPASSGRREGFLCL
jgi:predicted methyltransferase